MCIQFFRYLFSPYSLAFFDRESTAKGEIEKFTQTLVAAKRVVCSNQPEDQLIVQILVHLCLSTILFSQSVVYLLTILISHPSTLWAVVAWAKKSSRIRCSRFWEIDHLRESEGKDCLHRISKLEWKEYGLLKVFGWALVLFLDFTPSLPLSDQCQSMLNAHSTSLDKCSEIHEVFYLHNCGLNQGGPRKNGAWFSK